MIGDRWAYAVFAVFVAAQAVAARKRWSFCADAERALRRTFRWWLMAPYVAEAAAVAAILVWGRPVQLLYLAIVTTFVIAANGAIASIVCAQWAREVQVEEASAPASIALPLNPRRLGDYTSRTVEWLLAIVNVAAIGLVVWLYRGAPWTEWRAFGARPVLLVYGQVGLLLAKRALVAWRTAAPAGNAEEYLAWKENSRRFWINVCDSVRILCAGEFALFAANLAVELAAPVLVGTSLAMMGVWMAWYARRRRAYLETARRIRPTALPVIDEQAPSALVCFRPEYPALLLRTETGYSLNLASRRAQVGALYFAGLAAIVTVWR